MPIVPIRNLGQIGVITDVNAYDLPPNAVSMANNARFDDGKIKRSFVFRSVLNTSSATPVYTFTYSIPNSYDKIGIADRNGRVWFYQSGSETDVTQVDWFPQTNVSLIANDYNALGIDFTTDDYAIRIGDEAESLSDEPYTYTYLQGVGYLNRSDRVPWYYADGSSQFANLPNWNSTWRCKSLRAYKDYLVALNVTKGSTEYPTMVKWSDIAQYNAVPGSWDETLTTNSAGENTLAEMKTPILDGLPLRDVFILYSQEQVWMMEETGDALVFRFRKLFENIGIINTNCCIEVDGRHYVFGFDDIYVHDGNSVETILDGRNWHYVYNNLNKAETSKFWVQHNPYSSEIMFAYVSGDANANFIATSYPNRAAVYNYKNQTWSFVDLPLASRPTSANFSTSTTWANATGSWDASGGTWYGQDEGGDDVLFMAGVASTANGLTASRLYGYEEPNGGVLPFGINTEATKPMFVERIAIDLDDTGEELRAYKVIKSIYPQVEVRAPSQTVDFKFDGVEFPGSSVTWSTQVSFTPNSGYKVDTRENGRYLAWRMDSTDNNDFEVSGFDLDVVTTGRR
jgi:hypothetical protein